MKNSYYYWNKTAYLRKVHMKTDKYFSAKQVYEDSWIKYGLCLNVFMTWHFFSFFFLLCAVSLHDVDDYNSPQRPILCSSILLLLFIQLPVLTSINTIMFGIFLDVSLFRFSLVLIEFFPPHNESLKLSFVSFDCKKSCAFFCFYFLYNLLFTHMFHRWYSQCTSVE